MITTARSRYTYLAGGDGRQVPFGANSMQHGTAVFEGIRCYLGALGPCLFRLEDHLARLLRSAELVGIGDRPGPEELREHVIAAATGAGMADCYVRPVLYAPDAVLGLDLRCLRYSLGVEIWPGHSVHGHPGVTLAISPWRRPPGECFPAGAKATGVYVLSAVARTKAARDGFDDAVQLDMRTARVVEATVANIFLVKDGRLLTPWLQDGPLAGITRDTVLALAGDLGIPACEGPVEVTDLREADEIFLTGTAAELVPARALEDRPLDPAGPVFTALAARFRAAVTGCLGEREGWLTTLPTRVSTPE